ncbi:MAG: D-alanyl-D-alanine carboxypeptidase [Bacteroidetes bacterium]|nr:D-alanyl-D-alanine carboxypeptidase [Bacteroidota bacterium]
MTIRMLRSLLCGSVIFLFSCSTQKKIDGIAKTNVLDNESLKTAHIGISVFDPSANQYLYNHQGEKYFVPASNTKLFSLYAGMKYLGDSLTGIRFIEKDTAIFLLPAGDPTLLHADFKKQPVIDFLKATKKNIYVVDFNWDEQALGLGWSWDDYNDDYMVERSALPVYGNIIKWVEEKQKQEQKNNFEPSPFIYSIPEVNWKVKFTTGNMQPGFFVKRRKDENVFDITQGNETYKAQDVPFVTNGLASAIELLKDTIGKEILITKRLPGTGQPSYKIKSSHIGGMNMETGPPADDEMRIIHSQLADSLFVPMMYRSDNFFAEQTLLMASNEKLGVMNDQKIIDTLLKTDLKELPQTPYWADGSGLSRFNLFSPNDFTWLLNKMKNEFGMERMKRILPTGGRGTLRSYYKSDNNYIFAKTGSLTGVICLSGYLYTVKGKLLIFSVLVNNHNTNSGTIRKAVEGFLLALHKKY